MDEWMNDLQDRQSKSQSASVSVVVCEEYLMVLVCGQIFVGPVAWSNPRLALERSLWKGGATSGKIPIHDRQPMLAATTPNNLILGLQ